MCVFFAFDSFQFPRNNITFDFNDSPGTAKHFYYQRDAIEKKAPRISSVTMQDIEKAIRSNMPAIELQLDESTKNELI